MYSLDWLSCQFRWVFTSSRPGLAQLWLSLLGAVFMMVLICLYALETALAPFPERKLRTPIIPSQHETIMQEQTVIDEPPEVEQKTEMIEPEVFIHDTSGEDNEVVSLVEVEEIPTHPPFPIGTEPDLAEMVTEQNGPTQNPDGPVLTVPSTALRRPWLGHRRGTHGLRRGQDPLSGVMALLVALACATPPSTPDASRPAMLTPCGTNPRLRWITLWMRLPA